MKITAIKQGKFYETKVGSVGIALRVGGTHPPSVKLEIRYPRPMGVHYVAPRDIVQEVPDPAARAKPASTIERFKPIKMELGFAIRALMVADGKEFSAPFPTAEELSAITRRHPELVPAPGWTVEQCVFALAHPTELATPTGKDVIAP